MDRNGYNKSIMNTASGVCFICGRETETARHEIFYGEGERKLSKLFGLWVNLCPECHAEVHEDKRTGKGKRLAEDGKAAFISRYSEALFIKVFQIGNVKEWEVEELLEDGRLH